jgi:hypothetical protein
VRKTTLSWVPSTIQFKVLHAKDSTLITACIKRAETKFTDKNNKQKQVNCVEITEKQWTFPY